MAVCGIRRNRIEPGKDSWAVVVSTLEVRNDGAKNVVRMLEFRSVVQIGAVGKPDFPTRIIPRSPLADV